MTKELLTSNQMFTRDEWTMQGQLYLRPGQDVPFTSRWVRAEWADQEIERLRAALEAASEALRYRAYELGELANDWSATTVSHEARRIKAKAMEACVTARKVLDGRLRVETTVRQETFREAIDGLRAIKCRHGNNPLSCPECQMP